VGITTTHVAADLPGADATIADFRGIDIRRHQDAFVVTLKGLGFRASNVDRSSP
jgi:hypothetical protein